MKTPFNITNLFFEVAGQYPNKIAIIEGNRQISYSDLQKEIEETSSYFLGKGLRKGDRVLVFIPMSITLYRVVLSLFRIGATAVFLDDWVSKKRMEECCRMADCKGFIGIPKAHLLRFFSPALKQIPIVLNRKAKRIKTILYDIEPTLKTDNALITFTTGSTGIPKAAMRSHGSLNEQFLALKEEINPSEKDVDITLLPIVLLINLAVGATSVIVQFNANKASSSKLRLICRQIEELSVNRIIASPFFVRKMADHILRTKQFLPGIQKVVTGGAPVFPAEAKLFIRAFEQAEVKIVYGSTEAEPISVIDANDLTAYPAKMLSKGLPVGRLNNNTEIKIICSDGESIGVDSNHHLMVCKPHEVGEIIVAGPHVLNSYFNNETAFKRNKMIIGHTLFHRTGDSGFLDEQGNLFLTGRCSAVFEANDSQIYPFLYENFFTSLDEVEVGTVMHLNNKITAILELRDESKQMEVGKKIRSGIWNIDRITYLKKMPRDPRHHSKIDYEKVKGMFDGFKLTE